VSTLPNKTPDLSKVLERVIAVAVRRRWWFSIAAFLVTVGSALGSCLIPNRYKSEATILVQQQQIPERYVTPNSTTDLDQALQAMTHAVLSRPRLLKVIADFNLYPNQRKRLSSEQLVELMRNDITIESLENPNDAQRNGPDAFSITYIGSGPEIVQQVTDRLQKLFVNEDLQTQEQRDVTTTSFLENQLGTAQADLNAKEARLRDFKMANLGELPEQQQGNLQILGGVEAQLQSTNAALSRANEQRTYLQSLIAQYRNLTIATGSTSPNTPGSNPIDTTRAELNRLQNERTTLLGTFSPQYPDVKQVDREIAETQALLARLQKQKTEQTLGSSASQGSLGDATTDTTVAQLNSQLKANELEIANDTEQIKREQEQISEYQHRLNLTPVREQQLTDLESQYDLAKKNYDDLYTKKTQSALATDLQKDQQGEQFKLIDPPNLPTKPFSPNRLAIAIGGLAGGIALGVALAYLIEILDSSLHSEIELRARFDFPIVMGTPLLINARERRMRARKSALQWCAGTVMLLAVLAAEYYVYRRG
jgi:polysaccharide biosynthesis transport protein